jgi:hypothetical protein
VTYLIRKPAWFGEIYGRTVISPAAVIEVADWWDAWRLVWMAIGAFVANLAVLWSPLGP